MKVIYFPLLLLFYFSPLMGQSLTENHLTLDGHDRFYFIFVPSGLETPSLYPLLIVLHGGGGNAKQIMEFVGFNALAQKEKFLAIYPNGYKKSWHDGRIAPSVDAYKENIDDVKFIQTVIDEATAHFPIDPSRIFVTGISNGAMMSLHLAYKLSDKIRAIAPVCGSIAENIATQYKPTRPISILVINGTGDKLVPYEGGPVLSQRANRGRVISTVKMMEIWKSFSHVTGKEVVQTMTDADPSDGCTADRIIYPAPEDNPIQLIRVNHGGHTWPGGKQYLPKMIVGNVCRDFKAEEVIWEFFENLRPLK